MRITRISTQRLRLPLDPPFYAAWDPVPRTAFEATIVRVGTDEGLEGIGSGDTMAGFAEFEHLFMGADPLAIARHVRDAGDDLVPRRPLLAARGGAVGPAGRRVGQPVSVLLGGASRGSRRTRRGASCGRPQRRADDARGAGRATAFARSSCGSPATGSTRASGVVAAVRDAVGDSARAHRRPQPVVADAGGHRARRSAPSTRAGRSTDCASTACCGSRSRSTATTSRGCGRFARAPA